MKTSTVLKTLKTFGLSLPGTQPKSPWPGHQDVAVNDKTFAWLSVDAGTVSVGLKLPVSRTQALQLPCAAPMGYGLGKSGWVSLKLAPGVDVPLETLKRWMLES